MLLYAQIGTSSCLAALETAQVKALKFEIVRNNAQSSVTKHQPVSGYISVQETDVPSLETLQKLSNGGITEKFTLFYQNYAFSLLGASFRAAENTRDLNQAITFAFHAKDVMLLRESSGY